MSRTWWVHRLFGRTARPTRRTRPGAKPAVTHLEDRTVPATLTESVGPLGPILSIDLDTAGELVTVASLGGVYQFTTTGTFTDGGVTAGNFTGLGTNSLTLDDSFAYAEIQFTDSQPAGSVRFDDGGGNTFDQPFTLTLDDPGSTVEFAGTTNFDANDLTVSAAGPVTQTGGDLTAGNLTVTGSFVDLTAGANTFFSVRGGATAGRFDLATAAGFFVPGPGLAATGTIALTLNGGGTLAVLAPVVSDTGNVELVADGMTIQAAIQAPAAGIDIDHGNVYLLTATLGRPITLAFATSPTKLSVSAAELAQLTAGRLVQIGDPLAGDLTVTQAVPAQAGFSKLILGTGGNLTQNANSPITVDSLGLFLDVAAAAPQTVTLTAPGNDFRVFASESKDTAEITVVNTGDLTVDAVGSIPGAVANNLTLTTSGNLTLANTVGVANVLALTAGGVITQTAGTVAAGRLTADAGAVDVTLGGNAFGQVSGSTSAGKFLVTTATDLEVVAPGITAAETITLSAGSGKTVTVNAPVLSVNGNAEIIADDAAINDTFAAPAAGTDTDHGNVYLLVQTGGRPMALAAAPVAGKFSVSADELARLTAGRLVQLGDNIFSGAVAITQGFTAPAGFSRFLIGSAGDITQDPTAGFVVDSFGVFMADGGAAVATLTAAGNDIRVFAGEGGNTDDIIFASTGPLTIGSVGTVIGLTGRILTVTARSPLTVASDVNGVGDVTLTATDSAAAGDDLTVNPGVTVRSQTGTVTLQAGDNLAVGAGAVLKADAGAVNLLIDFGDADPGVGAAADISTAALFAPLGVTLTGGPDADTFTVAASANAAVHVNGLTPSLPTLPGDTLNFVGSGGAVTFTPGATPDKGTFQDGALLPVTFEEIESLSLSGVGSLTVNGTNGPDTLVLYQAGGTTFFQLNGTNPVAIAVSQFTFNGLAANDTMIVDYAGGDPVPVGGAVFDGTDKAGDVLCALGAAGFSATYLPDAATTGTGTVTVNGKVIGFQNVGDAGNTVGIDIVGFDTATLLTPNANDQLTVANGATFCPPNDPALVVSGKSGLTPITPVAFRGNKTLTLDTETGSAGDDTVTVASADNAHLNTNLIVTTGAGADAVDVTGAATVAGDILIASKDITVSATVTATGGSVTLVNTGVLLLNGATVVGNAGVAQLGGGPVQVTGSVAIQSAAGPVSVNSKIDAGVLPASLTITAPSATAGVVALNGPVGTASRPDSLTVTAGKQITLNADQYLTGADQKYTGSTVVSAGTVTFGSTAGKVEFDGTLDGATAGTSNVTVTAPGDTTFGGAVGADKALASLTTDGGGATLVNGGGVATTGDQTYQDAVVVGKDTTFAAGGKVTFADTLDGGFAVTVTAAGLTTFGGKVGNGTPLASLTVNGGGTTTVNGKLVKTAGDQQYDDAVEVGADATFAAGGKVTFASTLDGGFAVAVTAPGDTTFTGAVGGATPLASLTTDGGGVTKVAVGVTTTGGQTYDDAVEATGPTVTFTSTGSGDIRFNAGLTGATAAVLVNTAGETLFTGGVAVRTLTTDADGKTRVTGGTVSGTDGLTFLDPVTVNAATTFQSAAGNILFDQTLDGASVTATVAAGKTITFNDPVTVAALTTNAAGGTTVVNAITVTATTGDLTFNTDVTTSPAIVTFTGKNVTFNGLLTGPASAVFVNSPGVTAFNKAVSVGSLTTDAGGTTAVAGGTVSGTNGLTFLDAVTAVTDTLFQSAAGSIIFNSTLDGAKVTASVSAGQTIVFNDTVTVAALTTLGGASATAVVNTPTITATGDLLFDTAVTVSPLTVTFTGKNVTFNGPLTGPATAVTVNAAGLTTFNAAVFVGSLTTDAGGSTAVNSTTVTTVNGQTYNDAFVYSGVVTLESTGGGAITFNGKVDGAAGANLNLITGGDTVFNTGPVNAASLSTDPVGRTLVNTPTFAGTGGIRFNDPVVVQTGVTFSTTNAAPIVFGSTLDGGFPVTVTAAGTALFAGKVGGTTPLASLTVNGPGGAVVAADVRTTGPQTYDSAVEVSGATVTFTSTGSGDIRFNGRLFGTGTGVTVNTAGVTTFSKAVSVSSLTTDAGGSTAVNSTTVTTVNGQTYNDAFVYSGVVTLESTGGGAITFNGKVDGAAGANLNLITGGDTVFNTGPVNAASLSTDPVGRTLVNTPTFAGTGGIRFNDPVVVQTGVTFSTTGSPLVFASTLDGGFQVVVTANGPVAFYDKVGNATPLTSLTVNGPETAEFDSTVLSKVVSVTTSGGQTYTANVSATGRTVFTAGGTIAIGSTRFQGDTEIVLNPQAGVTQEKTSTLTVPLLTLNGAGQFLLDSPQNTIATFRATIGQGTIYLSTAGNLALAEPGVTTGDGTVRIRTGGGFTAGGGGANPPPRLVNVGTGQFAVFFGLAGAGATATFTAEVTAAKLSIGTPQDGRPTEQPFVAELAALQAGPLGPDNQPLAAGFTPGANAGPDRVEFRPSAVTPMFLFGNLPTGADFRVTGQGDTLTPTLDATVVQFTYDGEDGTYVVDGRQLVQFFNFEKLGGASVNAFAVQTAEPGDAFGATSQQFAIRVLPGQSGQLLTGGLDGQRQPDNPFVVSPALVNPAAPTQPPRVAFGAFSGGALPDLVLANGPGTPSLVTVINGRFLTAQQVRNENGQPVFDNGLPVLNAFQFKDLPTLTDEFGTPAILAQFYAFEPTFQGGVNVAVGNLEGTTGAVNIVVAADTGGGPRVRTFRLDGISQLKGPDARATPQVITNSPFSDFFAYERSFSGGVRVAVADVTGDGRDDLVVTAGPGGGPRVRVFDGAAAQAQAAAEVAAGQPITLVSNQYPAYADFFTVEPTFRGGLYVDAGTYNDDTIADIVVGAAGGGGPRVMVFDGSTVGKQPAPTVLANFFAFTNTELTDPFLPGGDRTGVGGVTFGPQNTTTKFRDILVSTARGPKVVVRQLPGDPKVLNGSAFDPSTNDGVTDLVGPNGLAKGIPPFTMNGVNVDPARLNYGATVGGRLDPSV